MVRRVVNRERRLNKGERNGKYWGMMKIRKKKERGMGYKG